jgi:hypothetical protein
MFPINAPTSAAADIITKRAQHSTIFVFKCISAPLEFPQKVMSFQQAQGMFLLKLSKPASQHQEPVGTN